MEYAFLFYDALFFQSTQDEEPDNGVFPERDTRVIVDWDERSSMSRS